MPQILLVAGSPASGKSTISRTIAQRSPKGMHIPVDDLRTMVIGGVVHPGPSWNDELVQQLELARMTAIHTALRYREAGFLVVIDDFWDPYSRLREYKALDSEPDIFRILLRPAVEVAIERLIARQPHSEMRDSMVEAIRWIDEELEVHAPLLAEQKWHVVDTSTGTIDDCVDHIFSLIGMPAS